MDATAARVVDQSPQQQPSCSPGPAVLSDIDGVLDGLSVGRLVAEGPVTGETGHPALVLKHQDRMSLVP